MPERWVALAALDVQEALQQDQRGDPMTPEYINPVEWNQAIGLARQSCARIFRDGGTPADALAAFGLNAVAATASDWTRAVTSIAEMLCTHAMRKAA